MSIAKISYKEFKNCRRDPWFDAFITACLYIGKIHYSDVWFGHVQALIKMLLNLDFEAIVFAGGRRTLHLSTIDALMQNLWFGQGIGYFHSRANLGVEIHNLYLFLAVSAGMWIIVPTLFTLRPFYKMLLDTRKKPANFNCCLVASFS